jgi:hypothetical protein
MVRLRVATRCRRDSLQRNLTVRFVSLTRRKITYDRQNRYDRHPPSVSVAQNSVSSLQVRDLPWRAPAVFVSLTTNPVG